MAGNDDGATRRAAIYASTPDNSTASIGSQLGVARSCAEHHGLEVAREYVDLRGNRAQLRRLIADATAAAPPFGTVVVYALSRISRRAGELNQHSAQLAANGVALVSATEPGTPTVGTSIGEHLSAVHSESVRRGMRAAAAKGFYVFGRAPYGYRKVAVQDGAARRFKLELEPATCDVARWVFELRIEGATDNEIAAELNASRARSPTSHRWTSKDVRRILSNEVYSGTSVASSQDMANPDTAVRVRNAFPAIVSQEEFYQVQRTG